jgi:nitroreductase
MEIDKFLELVRERRSIRRFKPDPIPDEYIEKILEAARWAMSGANAQPWEFIVVKDQETKNKIANILLEQRRIEYRIEQIRIEELRHPGMLNPPSMPGFKDAPVLIVVCGDRRTLMASVLSQNFDTGEGGTGAAYIKNMANPTQIMQLAAAALGLGSHWLSISRSAEGPIKAILDVPDLLEIHTIVPVGYAAYKPLLAYRRELNEIVHFEKYDRRKFRSIDDIIKYLYYLREQTGPAYKKAELH